MVYKNCSAGRICRSVSGCTAVVCSPHCSVYISQWKSSRNSQLPFSLVHRCMLVHQIWVLFDPE